MDDEHVSPRNIADVNDYLFVPGCPPIHSIDFPKGMHFRHNTFCKNILDTAINMRKSSGILVNTFDALEYRAKEAIANGLCVPGGITPPVFFVTPLVDVDDVIKKRGNQEEHECLKWLETQPSKSVIFLCFGRRGLFSKDQLKEIAIGLEKSGCRFLWSVRNPPGMGNSDPDLGELLPEGFLERNRDKGMVIKTWAPQKEVLSHDSVGGFVTHCGRSSILEAVSFGVPMIAFPMYAEQRMNRVFMVEEMKVALPLDDVAEGFVSAVEVEKRVRELMETPNGRAVRERVAELKVAGRKAVAEGGSSVVALQTFVNLVMA